MSYDGIVAKIFDEGEDKIFLFFLDPETNLIKDGLDILDGTNVYKDLSYDTLMVVEVLLKDGTKEVDIEIDDFINGKYGKYDIFIHIKDLLPFKLGKKDEKNDLMLPRLVEDVILDGEFQEIAVECVKMCKEEMLEINNKENDEDNVQFFN